MAEAIGSLRAELSANHAAFTSDMNKAKAAVQSSGNAMVDQMNKVKNSFDGSLKSIFNFKSLMVGMIPTVSITAFVSLIQNAINSAAELNKLSQVTGTTVEQLSTLKYAATMSGLGLDQLANGMVKFSKAAEASSVSEELTAFDALNIDLKNTDGSMKSVDKLLLEVAAKFKGMSDGVTKTAVATQLFGKAGAELIPLLNKGSDGIQQLQDRARELGLELSTSSAQQASQFNRALKELKAGSEGLALSIASDMLPALNNIITAMRQAQKEGGTLWAIWIGIGGAMLEGGKAIFGGPNTQQAINKLTKTLAEVKKAQSEQSDPNKYSGAVKSLEDQIALLKKKQDAEYEAGRGAAEAAEAEKERQDKAKKAASDAVQKELELAKVKDEAGKKSAAEAERIKKLGDQTLAGMQKEVDLYGEVSKAEKTRYELEHGDLSKINSAQKQKIQALAEEIDLLNEIEEIDKETQQSYEDEQKKIDSINEQVAALKLQAETLNMTAREATLYKLAQDGASASQLENADVMLKAVERMNEYKRVVEAIKTPQQTYDEEIKKLKEDLESGLITWDQYTEAVQKAKEALESALGKNEDAFKELQKAIEGFGKKSASAIAEFAISGKSSFGDMAQSIMKDILEMLLYQTILKQAFNGIGSWFSGLFTPTATAGGGGGGGGGSPGVSIATSTRSMLSAANSTGVNSVAAASTGIKSGTRQPTPIVNIYNNNGSQVTESSRQTADGTQIDVMIDKAVAGKMGTFGSSSNKTLRQNFGAKQSLVSR